MALLEQQSGPRRTVPRSRSRRLTVRTIALICLATWIYLLVWKWPFTQKAVESALNKESLESVHIGSFHPTFFPLGYVAENVHFAGNAQKRAPEMTLRKLVIVASWLDLLTLTKRLDLVSIEGLRVIVPNVPASSSAAQSKSAPPRFLEIGQVHVKNSSVELSPSESDPEPFSLTVQDLTVNHMSSKRAGSFSAIAIINKPRGPIRVSGQIGPWHWNNMGNTRLSGTFDLRHADLNAIGGLGGLLDMQGKFAGPLNHIHCSGTADVPQLRASADAHEVHVSSTFAASVNGITGDTTLEQVDSHLNGTLVQSQGDVKQTSQETGKTASLRFSVEQGQLTDLLLLFTTSRKPAMTGIFDLRLNAELPPGNADFLKKLTFSGDFGIDRGHFTKPQAQQAVNELSDSARGLKVNKGIAGEDGPMTLSDLSGHFSARGGLATLSQIHFTIPGGHAVMSGTYNLLNENIHCSGVLRTTGNVSDTTSGVKAVMLKVLVPFLKKRSVTVVPFVITGTVQHPNFGLNLMDKDKHH